MLRFKLGLFILIIVNSLLISQESSWIKPGLTLPNGELYTNPTPNITTGKIINVLSFGANPNDSNYDNFISFKDAISHANPGDEIFIPRGSYYFKSGEKESSYLSHILLKSGVNIRGEGGSILLSNFSELENRKRGTTVISSISQSNITISNLTISSLTDSTQLPDKNDSKNNHFVGSSPLYGIVIDNNSKTDSHGNIRIDSVVVEKFRRTGVRIRASRDVTVISSTFRNATDLGGGGAGYGISIQGTGHDINLTDTNLDPIYNIVKECNFEGPYLRHGVLLQYYAHNNLVTENSFRDILLDSIDLHGEDEYSNEVSYNKIINTRNGAGIGLGNSGATHDKTGPFNYIHHNRIIGGKRGIDVLFGTTDSIIVDNIVEP